MKVKNVTTSPSTTTLTRKEELITIALCGIVKNGEPHVVMHRWKLHWTDRYCKKNCYVPLNINELKKKDSFNSDNEIVYEILN